MGRELNFDKFRDFGTVKVYLRTSNDEIVEHIGDSDCIILNKVNITADVLDACPKVKLISILATGYNVVDLKAAADRGVTVCNVPSYSTDSVAQMVFALIFELVSKVGAHSVSVKSGDWSASKDFCYTVQGGIGELAGKTLGIIGYGAIGKKVAAIASAFGMKLLINNRTPFEGSVSKEKVFAESDFVTLHCPLTADNAKMINADALSGFKDGAYLINTARGGLVDDQALADALNSGKLAGAGLDVLSQEPPVSVNPLIGAANCIITPHIAWATLEARTRLIEATYLNVKAFLENRTVNKVN